LQPKKQITMNKNFFPVIAFASIILLSCGGCGSSGSGNAITLKFNLSKGSRIDYVINMDMAVNESVMGNNVALNNKLGMGYIFEVVGDSAGWKKVSSTIHRINMKMNVRGQTISFDTDSVTSDTTGASGMMLKIFGAMKGGQFTFTMDEKGHVGEVSGMREMMQHVVSTLNIPNAEAIMQNMGKSFDDANFRQNIEQSFSAYPDKPVKPGDSWTRTTNINSNGVLITSENTYTLNSVQGDKANVKVSTRLSSGADSTSSPAKGITGTMNGETNFDIPTGIPVNSNLDMIMNMKVSAQGQEIPVSMDIKMMVTSKKL
jgi:Family of unknown function (DUF6263)